VRIRRAGFAAPQEITIASPGGAAPPPYAASHAAPSGEGPKEKPEKPVADPNLVLVKSPIVGTFYEAPSPDAPTFVRVGERIQPGKVLCIIESMKLMNEIEAEVSGVIESKLVMNGQPVEYGEALFAIRTI
jgi:acetyl-CoA carboxylase biotin carboxyl carrier protein